MAIRPGSDSPVAVDLTAGRGVQIGQGNTQYNTFYLPAGASATWPCLVGRVPALADGRQRRPVDDLLATALDGEHWGGPAQVVSGMGGVGKTQLAAAVARDVWDRRLADLVVWVTASSREAVVTTYAAAAAAVTGRGPARAPEDAEYFLSWLASARGPGDRPLRWLVVLDDVQRPSDLRGLWPPATAPGATLVTTRRRDAALTAGRRAVDIDVFTPAESIRYLMDKLATLAAAGDESAELAADLGHLPLALAQVATFVLDRAGPPSRMTCARYRRLLADRRRRLADLFPAAESLPDEHASTITATWSLSIEHADTLPPAGMARRVLEIAALLNPNGIPVGLLTSRPVSGDLGRDSGREVLTEDVEETAHTLHRLNLITLAVADPGSADGSVSTDGAGDLDAGLVKMHALVQRAVRESTPPQNLAAAARTAADALLDIWPAVERQVGEAGMGQLLRTNTDSLRETAGAALCAPDVGVHPVLFRTGNSLGKAGLVASAFEYFDELASIAATSLGADHPDVLTARRECARWQGETGDHGGAVTALRELLPEVERILGSDHHDALTTRNELAWVLGEWGDVGGALDVLRDLVPALVRVLGPDHYDTLLTRHDLAGTWGKSGDPARAAEAFADVLPDCLRVLGPDNPLTLRVRHALAWHLGEAGDPAAAVSGLAQLLPDRTRTVGPYDPGTLSSRFALAHWRAVAGDRPQAVFDLAQVADDCTAVLGPHHPTSVAAREDEAKWRARAGEA